MIEVTHELCRVGRGLHAQLSPYSECHLYSILQCSNVPKATLEVSTGTWCFTLHSSNMCLCTCAGIGKKDRLHGCHAVNCWEKGAATRPRYFLRSWCLSLTPSQAQELPKWLQHQTCGPRVAIVKPTRPMSSRDSPTALRACLGWDQPACQLATPASVRCTARALRRHFHLPALSEEPSS